MSEVFTERNAIIQAAAERLVAIGKEVSEGLLDGNQPGEVYQDGLRLLNLFRAYTKHEDLEDKEVEALLYCMRKLSGAYEFPTVGPLVGQPITYVIEQAAGGSGGGGSGAFDLLTPGVDTVIWSGDGVTWQVITVDQLAARLAPHINKY